MLEMPLTPPPSKLSSLTGPGGGAGFGGLDIVSMIAVLWMQLLPLAMADNLVDRIRVANDMNRWKRASWKFREKLPLYPTRAHPSLCNLLKVPHQDDLAT